MTDNHPNLVNSLVTNVPGTGGTTLTVTTGTGTLFSGFPFNATVWASGSQFPTAANAEIVRITNQSGDTLTIARAQEGTSARSITTGDNIAVTITAKSFTDIETLVAANLPKSGGTMTGNITLAGDASSALQPVTLQQLQAAIIGLDDLKTVRATTTTALPTVTYSNGSSGVGATLIAVGTGALVNQDGITLVTGDTLLVKNQVSAFQNGKYTVTNAGSLGVAFILTRSTDADQASENVAGTTIVVQEGSLAGSYWDQVSANPITMGTTNLVYNRNDIGLAVLKANNGSDFSSPSAVVGNIGAAYGLTDSGSVITGTTQALVANTIYRFDTTSNVCTATLPNTQPVGTRIKCKIIAPSTVVNFVTINTSGSDVINKSGGVTTTPLKIIGQYIEFQYIGSNIWVVADEGFSLTAGDARYLPGYISTTKGSANLVPQFVFDSAGHWTIAEQSLIVPRFGGLRTVTHSWGSYNGTGSTVGNFTNFIRRTAAAMNIPSTEIDLWYHGGMFAGSPNTGLIPTSTVNQGMGGVFRHAYPDHYYVQAGRTAPQAGSKAYPSLCLICLGVNDLLGTYGFFPDLNGRYAMTVGYRALLTRLRAAQLFECDNAAITYSGTWSAVQTDKDYVTAGKYKSTSTLNDYTEFTIPATFPGGVIALSLIGNPNGQTALSSAITSTSATSAAMGTRTPFPTSGQFVILVDSEQMLVTAGNGTGAGTFTVTRGYNGTTAATHLISAVVSRPKTTAYLDFSGSTSAASSTANLFIAGQGSSAGWLVQQTGTDIQMVQRFTNLTVADAGLKIRATLKGVLPGETFRPFDWIIEDLDPPTQLMMNQPLSPSTATIASQNATFNSDLASLAAEFTNCYVVDVATTYAGLFEGVVQAATSTGATIHMTPTTPSLNVLAKGSVLFIDAEAMLVTSAITKTSDSDWSFTVTRGTFRDGSSSGTTPVNHVIGAAVVNVLPWNTGDGLHQSDEGHALMAAQVISTIGSVPQTSTKIATSGGYKFHDNQSWPSPLSGVAYPLYRDSNGSRTTKATTQSKEYAEPFWVPSKGIFTYAATLPTTGAVASYLRFGIYTDALGAPGSLVFDTGVSSLFTTIASGSNTVNTSTFAGSGTLNVASTTGYPTSGTVYVETATSLATVTYTGTSGTTFTGCTTTAGGGVMSTGGMVSAQPASSAKTVIAQANFILPVTRGWYWRSVTPQGGAPTLTAVARNSPVANYKIPDPSSNMGSNPPAGLSRTSVAGALTDWDNGLTGVEADNVSFPLIEIGYETFIVG